MSETSSSRRPGHPELLSLKPARLSRLNLHRGRFPEAARIGCSPQMQVQVDIWVSFSFQNKGRGCVPDWNQSSQVRRWTVGSCALRLSAQACLKSVRDGFVVRLEPLWQTCVFTFPLSPQSVGGSG